MSEDIRCHKCKNVIHGGYMVPISMFVWINLCEDCIKIILRNSVRGDPNYFDDFLNTEDGEK